MLFVLVTTVLFGLPASSADTLSAYCQGITPLRDLAEVRLVCTRRYSALAETVAVKDVRGREGLQDSLQFDDQGLTWTCILVTRDTAGNESCPSNRIAVNLPPVSVPFQERVMYYDIGGRRIPTPKSPGVYFVREGARARRVVVRR